MNRSKPDVSLNVFDLIDSICSEFRRHWKLERRPDIEQFLFQVPEAARPTLFRNLLQTDIKYRERAGAILSSEFYLQRFPDYAKFIREAFDESTYLHSRELEQTASASKVDLTQTYEIPAANRIGDYELIRELGRGGFGVVYEAKHLERGNRIALKTLPTGQAGQEENAERLHRFRREFRSLAEINHPNLVGMQTLEVDGDQWFFTMDLLKGQDFRTYVRPRGQLDESRLRSALKQLVSGVEALHANRILHRDLKPSNILVSDDGHVWILDFGLIAELRIVSDETASMRSRHFAGTPKYAAPEQLFGERSAATDWYAVGVILYEALAGESPFTGSPRDILLAKQESNPPKLALQQKLPQDLAELADGLLHRDPPQRFSSSVIFESLGLKNDSQSGRSESQSEQHANWSELAHEPIALFGRESQLDELQEAKYSMMASGNPGVVWVTGLSGEGKSSLVQHFLADSHSSRQTLVLQGRCYDRESVPFKALDGVLDALTTHLRSLSETALAALLPPDKQPLAQLFPNLRRVPLLSRQSRIQTSGVDQGQIRKRAFFALGELLQAVGRKTTIIMWIDDLQWGDAESADGLFEVLSFDDPPNLFFIGSYRADERQHSDFLNRWHERSENQKIFLATRVVEVGPLTTKQCVEMIRRQLDRPEQDAEKYAIEVMNRTGGNPYLIQQLLDRFDPASDRFREHALEDIVEAKLKRLPEHAQTWLEVVAVAGKATPINDLVAFAGFDDAAIGIPTRMRSERLIRFVGSTDSLVLDTFHDRIRETVLDRLGPERRAVWHLRIGKALEKLAGLDPEELFEQLSMRQLLDQKDSATLISATVYDLAYHFTEAAEPKAFVYQMLAGEDAARAFAMESAREHLRAAEKFIPTDCPQSIQYRLWDLLGQVSLRLRDAEATFEYFQRCVDCASGRLERARAYSGIGLMHQQLGDLPKTMQAYDAALEECKRPRPKTKLGNVASCLGGLARVFFLPAKWQRHRSEEQRQAASLEFEMSTSMASFLFETEPILNHLRATVRDSLSALHTGADAHLAVSNALLATVFSAFGTSNWISRKLLNRSLSYQERTDSPELEGILRTWYATAHYFSGDTKTAEAEFERAIELTQRYGTDWDLSMTMHNYRRLQSWIASSGLELETARYELELAEKSKNPRYLGWAEFSIAFAQARGGRVNESSHHLERSFDWLNNWLSDSEFGLSMSVFHRIHAFTLLQGSDYSAAGRAAQQGWELVERLGGHAVFNVPSLCCWLDSLTGPNWAERTTPEKEVVIKKLLRKAGKMHFLFPTVRHRIDRSRGRAYSALGREAKAYRCFNRGLRYCNKFGMGYEKARSMLDLSVISNNHQQSLRTEAIAELRKLESVIPRAESWQLGKDFGDDLVAEEFEPELIENS